MTTKQSLIKKPVKVAAKDEDKLVTLQPPVKQYIKMPPKKQRMICCCRDPNCRIGPFTVPYDDGSYL